VTRLLEPFGIDVADWTAPMGKRTVSAVMERLQEWQVPGPTPTILYWVGHGWSNNKKAFLACQDSPLRVGDAGIETYYLADRIEARQAGYRSGPTWSVVIVDTCKSNRFVRLVNSHLSESTSDVKNVMLVGVSAEGGTTLGRFADALQFALTRAFLREPEIPLRTLIGHFRGSEVLVGAKIIDVDLSDDAVLRRSGPAAVGVALDIQPALDAALADLTQEERDHFIVKARSAGVGEPSWYFQGRKAELRRIARWLRSGRTGMLVVTGRAGTGKSALLGYMLANSWPGVRKVLVEHKLVEELDEDTRAPDDAFEATLHLTGAATSEVVDRLGVALSWDAPPVGAAHEDRLAALLEAAKRTDGAAILLDALDEARQPLSLARILREVASASGVRLVVGTRASTLERPDQPTTDENILDALGRENTSVVRVLRDAASISAYVDRRLVAAWARVDSPPTADDQRRVLAAVERAIKGREREFLFGSILAHELMARPELFEEKREQELQELLGVDHRGLFDKAVSRLSSLRPTHGPLLEALGLAFGRGMPIHGDVLGGAAAALSSEPGAAAGAEALTPEDIDRLLTDAAPYVLLDFEAGQTVYRLSHRTFQEHYLARDGDIHERHRRIAERLIAGAAPAGQPLNAYLARYLSRHIAECDPGTWRRLAERLDVVDQLNPRAVTADAQRAGFGVLPPEIAGFVSARALMGRSHRTDREGLRQVGTARSSGQRSFTARPEGRGPRSEWLVISAALRRHPVQISLHTGSPVHAVAAVAGPDGPLLATGSADEMLWLWNAAAGEPFGSPLDAGAAIRAVSACETPDGPRLVTGASGGEVGVLDPVAGVWLWTFATGSTDAVRAIAVRSTADGELRIATAGVDSVTVWNAQGERIGKPARHDRPVRAVAFAEVEGRTRLVTGSDDEVVRVWKLTPDGAPAGAPVELRGHADWVRSIAGFADHGSPRVAAGGDHPAVVIWNPTTRERIAELPSGPVQTIASYPAVDGGRRIATGGEDGSVRVWDATTGRLVGQPLTGHSGSVQASTAYNLGHTPRIATGGDDGTVRIWDPATAERMNDAPDEAIGAVHAITSLPMARGSAAVATGGDDGKVHFWKAKTGAPARGPITASDAPIRAMTMLDRRTLAVGGDDEMVRIVDARKGPTGEPLKGHAAPVRTIVASAVGGHPRLVTGSEDGTVRVWDLATREEIVDARTEYNGPVRGLALSGEDQVAVVGSDRTVSLRKISSASTSKKVLRGLTDWGMSVCACSATDGAAVRLVAGADDGSVRIWRPGSRNLDGIPLVGHEGSVRVVGEYSAAEGRPLVVSGGHDGSVRLWEPITGDEVHVIHLGLAVNALCPIEGALLVGTNEGHLVLDVRAIGSTA
jgi:WD40 repeat protein/ABC-type hemin transport system ATPase subunit